MENNQDSEFKAVVREWVESIVIAFVLAMFIRAFFFQAFRIPSGSMEHTLEVGDRLLVNKLHYGATIPFTKKRLPGFTEPKRGDIVVFKTSQKFVAHRLIRIKKAGSDLIAYCKGDSLLKYDKPFLKNEIVAKVVAVERNDRKYDYMTDKRKKRARKIAVISPYLVPMYWVAWFFYRISRKLKRMFC